MRKFGVFLLAIFLFISLLGFAISVSTNLAFTNPEKVKNWLNQSNLYGNILSDTVKQAQSSDDSETVPLNDPEIQKIARSTFSSELLQKNVNTIVDSNYAWLEGKSNTPEFRIDLASAKETFAERVGDYVRTRLANLPACTSSQLSTANTSNPLSLSCLPATADPEIVGMRVTEQITDSGAFLSDPVITASNLNPKGENAGQPYYQNLSGLPAVYQFGTKLPLIAALGVIASVVGIIFIPKRHRNGVRVVGIILFLAGLVLVAMKFVASAIFSTVHKSIFDSSNSDQIQQAVISFLGHAENQLINTGLWFGIAYVLTALAILLILRRMQKSDNDLTSSNNEVEVTDQAPERPRPTNINTELPPSPKIRADDLRLKPRQPVKGPPPRPEQSRPSKPPHLIQ